jgi:hypothetical protein
MDPPNHAGVLETCSETSCAAPMISDAGTIMSDANPGVPHESHMRARLETADLVTTAHGDQIKCINVYRAGPRVDALGASQGEYPCFGHR